MPFRFVSSFRAIGQLFSIGSTGCKFRTVEHVMSFLMLSIIARACGWQTPQHGSCVGLEEMPEGMYVAFPVP